MLFAALEHSYLCSLRPTCSQVLSKCPTVLYMVWQVENSSCNGEGGNRLGGEKQGTSLFPLHWGQLHISIVGFSSLRGSSWALPPWDDLIPKDLSQLE